MEQEEKQQPSSALSTAAALDEARIE